MKIIIVLYVSAIVMAVFLLQYFIPGLTEMLILDSSQILIMPWTLLTSIFLHGSLPHLLSNIFALMLFGFMLESIIGGKYLLKIFFVAGLIASVASAFFYSASLGASGAIFGIIGTLTMLRPKMAVYAFGIPMPMFAASLLWALLDLGGLFYPTDTANAAHLAGLAAGLVIGYAIRKNFKEPRRKKEKILTEKELEIWEGMYMRL